MSNSEQKEPTPVIDFDAEAKAPIDYGWGLVGIAVVVLAVAAPSEVVQMLGGQGQPGFGNMMTRAGEMWHQVTEIKRLGMAGAWTQSVEIFVRLSARIMVIWMLWRCMRSAIRGSWNTMAGWGFAALITGIANGVFNPWVGG